MCWCTPSMRTPHCGSTACHPPHSNIDGISTITGVANPIPGTQPVRAPITSPSISVELDADVVHLAHGNVVYKSQTEAMLTGLQEFCRANGVLVDHYRIRIEAVTK
jgi:hypothetical protein